MKRSIFDRLAAFLHQRNSFARNVAKTRLLKILFLSLALATAISIPAQTNSPIEPEILANADVVLMAKSGLTKAIIIRKINESKSDFDVSIKALVDLKNAGVDDEIIETIMERAGGSGTGSKTTIETQTAATTGGAAVSTVRTFSFEKKPVANVGDPKEILRAAKTVHIEKSSIHPSRQALEKELLKRKDWQALNLNIVRYQDGADLRVEIGRVPLSWISHRYVFRIYDNKTGTIIAAGETTSWGSLAGNLAREISKKLSKIS